MSRRLLASSSLLFAVGLVAAVVGCTDSGGNTEHTESHAGSSTGDTAHAETTDHAETTGETGHDTEAAACPNDPRADSFAIGLHKSGETVTASFMSADPAPPIKGDNTWVLSFTDASNQPLDGLTVSVVPMMPDHGHGTPVVAEVTPTENAGEYQITPVNLFMAGLWEITIEVSSGDMQDSLMFAFCVE